MIISPTPHHTNKHRSRTSANRPFDSVRFFFFTTFHLSCCSLQPTPIPSLVCSNTPTTFFYLYCACHRLAQPTRRGKKTRQGGKQYVEARPYVVERKSVVNDHFRRWKRVRPREIDGRNEAGRTKRQIGRRERRWQSTHCILIRISPIGNELPLAGVLRFLCFVVVGFSLSSLW